MDPELTSDMNKDEGTEVAEEANEIGPTTNTIRVSVAEKVIFCIDKHLLNEKSTKKLLRLLRHYQLIKRAIAVQPVEFYFLIYGKETKLAEITTDQDLEVLLQVPLEEETGPFDLAVIFQTLAGNFKLPNPEYFDNTLKPPPYVIHAILIFGRNQYLPKLTDPNSYYFFAKNDFFDFDILYLHEGFESKKCEKIAKALSNIGLSCSGYYHEADLKNDSKIQLAFNEFLGNQQIRSAQNKTNCKIDLSKNHQSVY